MSIPVRAPAKINLHQMPGSQSLEQLTSAVKAQLVTVREGDRLWHTDRSFIPADHENVPPQRRPLGDIGGDLRRPVRKSHPALSEIVMI